MASRSITIVEDDIDGTEAAETVEFALDGVQFEIDLSKTNADALRKSLDEYVAYGRRVGGRRARKAPFSDVDNSSVRAWAAANHVKISARGRIAAHVIDQYRKAGH